MNRRRSRGVKMELVTPMMEMILITLTLMVEMMEMMVIMEVMMVIVVMMVETEEMVEVTMRMTTMPHYLLRGG